MDLHHGNKELTNSNGKIALICLGNSVLLKILFSNFLALSFKALNHTTTACMHQKVHERCLGSNIYMHYVDMK